jgi:predicted membrane protein
MNSRVIIGVVIVLIGLGFLFDINVLRFIFPLFLVFIGVQILMGRRQNWDLAKTATVAEDSLHRVLIFSGINQKVVSSNFKSGEVVAIFGGGDIDLSSAKTKAKTIELELVAIFGGLKVRIPSDWSVTSEGVGILGGFDNKAKGGTKAVTVQLKGVAIFGGVEVVN